MVLCFALHVPRRPPVPFAFMRPAASLRVLAALLVAALLLAQTSNALHELLVPHRVCAEHGHRVHADEVSERGIGATAPVRGPAADAEGSTEPDHHEHCAPPARPEQARSGPVRAETATLAPIAGKAPAVIARLGAVPGLAILLMAPKQSPPG
jgi:hypothetical protein